MLLSPYSLAMAADIESRLWEIGDIVKVMRIGSGTIPAFLHRVTTYCFGAVAAVIGLGVSLLFLKQILDFIHWLRAGSWPQYPTSSLIQNELGTTLFYTGWVKLDQLLDWLYTWPADLTILFGLGIAGWVLGSAMAKLDAQKPKTRNKSSN